jgi:hypothetical protein
LRLIRQHLTFANVASALALFIAISGGTAVALNGTDTVQSDDLGPGSQVKQADVADNAVTSADVVNFGLTGTDIANGSLHYPKLAPGLLDLIPVAVVVIDGNGSIADEAHISPVTGSPTVTHEATGDYRIAFPGLSLGGNDPVICTYGGNSTSYGGEIRTVANEPLFVNLSDSGGSPVDDSFQCAVYDL